MKLFAKWLKGSTAKKEAAPVVAGEVPAAVGQEEEPIGHNRKILVVDDNTVVLKAFELKLATLGFKVLTATDGPMAVSCARKDKPDLIVLDVNFPPDVGSSGLQWDGFNIMQWLGRFKEVADIPVIIITSGDPTTLRPKALAAGAVAFFQKPINHENFLLAVRRTISQATAAKPTVA
ncbi:MAG: response regulator receiver protein [Pedosphaera sp.]|nr:response regulator receiver protein [Pedosphaera sp.]